jgi:hypothetical protein
MLGSLGSRGVYAGRGRGDKMNALTIVCLSLTLATLAGCSALELGVGAGVLGIVSSAVCDGCLPPPPAGAGGFDGYAYCQQHRQEQLNSWSSTKIVDTDYCQKALGLATPRDSRPSSASR